MEPEERKDVHTEHCCQRHGCKYGDIDCPVILYVKQQSFMCEFCEDDIMYGWSMIEFINYVYDLGFAAGHDDMHSQVM
jgi:hypothetical protein